MAIPETAGPAADRRPRQGLGFSQRVLKRTFDLLGAGLGLILTGWLIPVAAVLARLDTGGSGLFRQDRVGRHGQRFSILKIRTMRDRDDMTTSVTTANDARVTPLGRFFRRTKIDEIPQLINVLRGDMSFVGPRPDVPGFADKLQGEDRLILSVRPGITGPATLKYRNEEELLARCDDPETYNRQVFSDKVKINRDYIKNYRFSRDLIYLWRTVTGR